MQSNPMISLIKGVVKTASAVGDGVIEGTKVI